jgi:hypothetical protein
MFQGWFGEPTPTKSEKINKQKLDGHPFGGTTLHGHLLMAFGSC